MFVQLIHKSSLQLNAYNHLTMYMVTCEWWWWLMVDAKMTKVWRKKPHSNQGRQQGWKRYEASPFSAPLTSRSSSSPDHHQEKAKRRRPLFSSFVRLRSLQNWGQRMDVGGLDRSRESCDRFKWRARVEHPRQNVSLGFGRRQTFHNMVLIKGENNSLQKVHI